MLNRLFAEQWGKPSGLPGRLVGRWMAEHNSFEAGWTVSLLNIQPEDHVLEVGFGPGLGIELASEKAVRGMTAGVDISKVMLQAARKRNAAAIQAGRVELRHGDVSTLPFDDKSFDKAFGIHCVYFWPHLPDCLKELYRVLKPGGVLAITIKSKDKWTPNETPPAQVFILHTGQEIAQLLADAGFRDTRVEVCPRPDQFPGECILGVK